MRYVSGVDEKERQLADFRRKSEEYVAHLEAEIKADRERLGRLQRELEESVTSLPDRPQIPPILKDVASGPQSLPLPNLASGKQSAMIREAAKAILMEAGGAPMMQNEIRLKMEERGEIIHSDAPNELIKVALGRGKEFVHTPRKGWTLVSQEQN